MDYLLKNRNLHISTSSPLKCISIRLRNHWISSSKKSWSKLGRLAERNLDCYHSPKVRIWSRRFTWTRHLGCFLIGIHSIFGLPSIGRLKHMKRPCRAPLWLPESIRIGCPTCIQGIPNTLSRITYRLREWIGCFWYLMLLTPLRMCLGSQKASAWWMATGIKDLTISGIATS